MKLNQLKEGEECIIERIDGKADIRIRLLQLGFTRGTHIILSGRAPMGDPIEVIIRGSRFSLRGSEADCIEVKKEVCSRGCEVCARRESKLR